MPQLGELAVGSRHDLHLGLSPGAPDEEALHDDHEGAFGYVHSYETSFYVFEGEPAGIYQEARRVGLGRRGRGA